MDNNMGFHKERSYIRPQVVHPEIKTDGSMFDFVSSTFYSLFNRSIFIVLSGIVSTISNFFNSLFSNVNISVGIFSFDSYTTNLVNNFTTLLQLTTNLFVNLFNTIYYTVTNINLNSLLVTFNNSISFIFSINMFMGLHDTNTAFFEKIISYMNNSYKSNTFNFTSPSHTSVDYISKS